MRARKPRTNSGREATQSRAGAPQNSAEDPSRLTAKRIAESTMTVPWFSKIRSRHRDNTTPEKANPSMVREMTKNAKLLTSFAITRRWTRTWVKRATNAVVKASGRARSLKPGIIAERIYHRQV